jgi:hypothetical protein
MKRIVALCVVLLAFLKTHTSTEIHVKTPILLALVILCFVVTLAAQEKHPLEASVGVSAFSLGDGLRNDSIGWNVGFGIGVHRNISIATEFSGYTSDSDYVHKPGIRFCIQFCPPNEHYVPAYRIRQYLIGPRFSLPLPDKRFQIFAHPLAGRMTQMLDGDLHSGIGFGLGGGLDGYFSKHVGVRIFGDWLPNKVQSSWQKQSRLGIGLVFRAFEPD